MSHILVSGNTKIRHCLVYYVEIGTSIFVDSQRPGKNEHLFKADQFKDF